MNDVLQEAREWAEAARAVTREKWNNLSDDDKEFYVPLLSQAVVGTFVAGKLLLRARKAAKNGDYAKATYNAVLWVGHTNNLNATIHHKLSERNAQRKVWAR